MARELGGYRHHARRIQLAAAHYLGVVVRLHFLLNCGNIFSYKIIVCKFGVVMHINCICHVKICVLVSTAENRTPVGSNQKTIFCGICCFYDSPVTLRRKSTVW